MSRESDLQSVIEQARQAFTTGQLFLVVRLKIGGMWGTPGHGEVPGWGETLQAIEAAGWALDRWSVTADTAGGLNAFPVFRRGDRPSSPPWPSPTQDRR